MPPLRCLLMCVVLLTLCACSEGDATDFGGTTKIRAEVENANDQAASGFMYLVFKDEVESAKWFRKAAEQGHATAQFALGDMYDKGSGVPKNQSEAVKWFRKAAEQGHAIAQSQLGQMYKYGNGVPKDDIEAYAWYNLAAVRRMPQVIHIYEDSKDGAEAESMWYESAVKFRDKLNLTPEQIAQAEAERVEQALVKQYGTIPNFKCDGDMNVTYAIKPEGKDCIAIPTEGGKHKDLSDYKIEDGKFKLDDEKKAARLAAKQAEKDAKDAKKAQKQAIKQLGRKATLVNADRDQLIKFLVEELINDQD